MIKRDISIDSKVNNVGKNENLNIIDGYDMSEVLGQVNLTKEEHRRFKEVMDSGLCLTEKIDLVCEELGEERGYFLCAKYLNYVFLRSLEYSGVSKASSEECFLDYSFLGNSVLASLPEIYVGLIILVLLVCGLFIKEKVKDHLTIWGYLTLWVTFNTGLLYVNNPIIGFDFISFYNGSFSFTDNFIFISKLVLLVFFSVQVLLGISYISVEKIRYYEFYILSLLVLLGLLLLMSANDLIVLYLLMELQSLGLYLLIVFKQYSAYSVEASLKYLIIGAFTSGLYLLGVSILYGYTGLIRFEDLQSYLLILGTEDYLVVMFSLVLIVSSILFKLGVFPFHMWLPDVYEGAPTIITVFLAVLPKFAFIVVLMKLFYCVFDSVYVNLFYVLNLSIIGSWVFGSGSALYQVKIKRFLAYSAIQNIGFILLCFVINTLIGVQALLFYVLIYSILTLTVFAHILVLRYYSTNKSMKLLEHLSKLYKTNPTLVYSLSLTFFSMAGIPPLSGFLIKFYAFYAGMGNGLFLYMFIAVIFSVVSVVYYIRVIRLMHFTKHNDYIFLRPMGYLSSNLISYLSLSSILIFIYPEFFFNLTMLWSLGF